VARKGMDLWPEDVDLSPIETPSILLLQLAKTLAERTGGCASGWRPTLVPNASGEPAQSGSLVVGNDLQYPPDYDQHYVDDSHDGLPGDQASKGVCHETASVQRKVDQPEQAPERGGGIRLVYR
jgi:hypothetical protein